MISKRHLVSFAAPALVSVPLLAQPAPAQLDPAARQEAPIVITRRLPPSPDLLVRTVYIGDLDLAAGAGQREMEKRVAKAVDEICTATGPLPSYKGRMEKPCRDEAWESARWQMKDAMERADRGS